MVVCGLDEVGRGCLAGPLVAAAVVLDKRILGLKDSKKLTSTQRNRLFKKIVKFGLVKVELISTRQINNRGIGWANKEVFRKLITQIKADKYIIDGNLKIQGAESVVKADSKIQEVMAASIVAKVTRDKLMHQLHDKYPKYGWKTNVGYGTVKHIEAIREFGVVRYHRSVFVATALRNWQPNDEHLPLELLDR